jgi:hypothetical protein
MWYKRGVCLASFREEGGRSLRSAPFVESQESASTMPRYRLGSDANLFEDVLRQDGIIARHCVLLNLRGSLCPRDHATYRRVGQNKLQPQLSHGKIQFPAKVLQFSNVANPYPQLAGRQSLASVVGFFKHGRRCELARE